MPFAHAPSKDGLIPWEDEATVKKRNASKGSSVAPEVSRASHRPTTSPAALGRADDDSVCSVGSLTSILTEMTLVKQAAARRSRSEARKKAEAEKKKRKGGPVTHASRYGVSTTCLYDARGLSSKSSWDKLPLFRVEKTTKPRRRRGAIAPVSRRIHAQPWMPVKQSNGFFGEPPPETDVSKRKKKKRLERQRTLNENRMNCLDADSIGEDTWASCASTEMPHIKPKPMLTRGGSRASLAVVALRPETR